MPTTKSSLRRAADTADPQLASPLFTLLPPEIRSLIYIEFWRLCSFRQHIIGNLVPDEGHPGAVKSQWVRVPCITDATVKDVRFSKFLDTAPSSAERDVWGTRLKSEWCWHWACQEHSEDAVSSPTKPGLLSLVMACKRMYLECLPSLYANTTFIFTDTYTAGSFLDLYGEDPEDPKPYSIRSLEVCLRITNLMTEIYYPPAPGKGDDGPPAIFASQARPTLSMKNNPWQFLCDMLVQQPNLQDLRIWLDSTDLRPWHKRVSETRFFGRLFDVKVPDKSRFVVGLPELPARRGPDSQDLEGHYLEGEKLEKVPFTLERGERPNNWRIHLRNIVSVGGLTLAPQVSG